MTNDECWEKFQFRLSITQKHPVYGEDFTLEGLAADAFSRLERKVEDLEKAYERLHQKYDWTTSQEMYRLKDEIKKRDIALGKAKP
jgi:hypothetical protein